MNHKKIYTVLFVFFTLIQLGISQEENKTFIAEKGDGIISILRGEGLDVNTYYQKFLDLNEGNISNGSLLKLGKTYKIPAGPDSFRNMGRKINVAENVESAIFDTKLYSLRKKDTLLRNTVYYLLFDKFNETDLKHVNATSENRNEIALAIAEELLEQGARVFLFEYNQENAASLGDYVAAINTRFLKFKNEYQRLLVLDVDNGDFGKTSIVSIEHNQKSEEGKKFANNLARIFKNQKMKLNDKTNKDGVFNDKTNIYLANNVLPAMTYIKIDNFSKNVVDKEIAKTNKTKFVDILTTGIQIDYSNIVIED